MFKEFILFISLPIDTEFFNFVFISISELFSDSVIDKVL